MLRLRSTRTRIAPCSFGASPAAPPAAPATRPAPPAPPPAAPAAATATAAPLAGPAPGKATPPPSPAARPPGADRQQPRRLPPQQRLGLGENDRAGEEHFGSQTAPPALAAWGTTAIVTPTACRATPPTNSSKPSAPAGSRDQRRARANSAIASRKTPPSSHAHSSRRFADPTADADNGPSAVSIRWTPSVRWSHCQRSGSSGRGSDSSGGRRTTYWSAYCGRPGSCTRYWPGWSVSVKRTYDESAACVGSTWRSPSGVVIRTGRPAAAPGSSNCTSIGSPGRSSDLPHRHRRQVTHGRLHERQVEVG